MADPHENLAEQALSNLVNQFARPLDFLRELVQNSIDAGSPRIEVSVDFDSPKPGETTGVTRVHVEDWGEGMDEEIIDSQLTRLFSSAKEGDLTKIGKFGIGFTSIFAILPDAVLLRTGRHGENWELLFHRDRSFDKVRIDEPIDGTKITLFKRMARDEVDRFVEEARFILTYWCEHSNVPVSFWDRTEGVGLEELDEDDPFAAFESEQATTPGGPEPVNKPLDVEADLSVRHRKDDVEVVVGIAQQPLYGYYNGGLTLLRTRNLDALGEFEDALRHLVFKVKNDALEHTLTRDNVLQDVHWERAMAVVLEARLMLADALVERLGRAVNTGEDPTPWQAHLARICDQIDVQQKVRDAEPPLFRSVLGDPVTLKTVEAETRKLGPILLGHGDSALHRGIRDEHDIQVLHDSEAVRDLLAITAPSSLTTMFAAAQREMHNADAVFVIPQILHPDELDDQERKLIDHTEELLKKAVGRRLSMRVGDFGGPEAGASEALVLNGKPQDKVFQRKSSDGWWAWLPAILKWRTMLVNRHHPLFRAQLLASTENPWLAAAGLGSALLHVEDIEGSRPYRHLLAIAHARLGLTA